MIADDAQYRGKPLQLLQKEEASVIHVNSMSNKTKISLIFLSNFLTQYSVQQ